MAAAADKVQEYLEHVEDLPRKFRRNLQLMRDLDERVNSIMEEIEKLSEEFVKSSSNATPMQKKEAANKIQKLQNQAKSYADDKVNLAEQNSLLLDKHIKGLDSDMALLATAMKTGQTHPALNNNCKRRSMPKYCICRDEEDGEMISCDNPKCLIEWFHIKCVGLESVPEGKWFCGECKAQKQTN